ncbi:MAG: nucleotidyltransferase domain-containing protein [Nitrospirae bacterium]|nr:nucleotidyltransferase domain-containing protein [Nitrospirota bacterium]MBF0535638.1 nucleotidyltransferase domain-containing protein [Nitrospirota bacterium]MBF0616944.1 nucleotidyltransferase domain-containing protein [Nitrospirota bacterium]
MSEESDKIIFLLSQYKKQFAGQYGIISLGVFGSVARREMRGDSDVDIVIKITHPNIVTLSRIRLEIEELVSKHVDIVHYREKMNTLLKERIDKDTIYV